METESLVDSFRWRELERVLVLSPHLDDAALSCCGLVTELGELVDLQVVTICAGNPAPKPTWSQDDAREMARRDDPERELTSRRRGEDVGAMERLDVNYVHLGFEDAIYRRSPTSGERIYQSSREKWVAPRIDDARHIEELFVVLRQMCRNMGRILLVAPMGIGFHMDHSICAHVAMRLENESVDLLFFEDFPYVIDPSVGKGIDDSPAKALARMEREPERRYFVPIDVERKARVLDEYESQIPLLFGEWDDAREAVRSNTYDGKPVECFWTANPPQ